MAVHLYRLCIVTSHFSYSHLNLTCQLTNLQVYNCSGINNNYSQLLVSTKMFRLIGLSMDW